MKLNPLLATIFFLSCSFLLSSCSSETKLKKDTSGLFTIKQNGKYGFIDNTGKIVINPQFDQVYGFREGLCAVCIGVACTDGNYNESTYVDRKYGFIDATGKFIINPQYDRADYFSDGLAAVWIKDKRGYIDKTGKMVIPLSEQNPFGEFSEGFVHTGSQYLDKTGKPAFDPQKTFGQTGDFSEGLAWVQSNDRYAFGYIDKTGKVVIDFQFEPPQGGTPATKFTDGLAVIGVRGKNGYIDKTGKIVINPQFLYADPFSEGLACVQVDGYKFGFIDKTGKFVINPQFDSAGRFKGSVGFSEGLAVVGVGSIPNTKYGFIDKTGKFIINPQFDSAGDFLDGIASVRVGKDESSKDGYIDKTGKFIWNPTK